MSKRLFTFIDSTDFGQTMGATFDLAIEGSVVDMRITTKEDCFVKEPIFEKVMTEEQLIKISKISTKDLERIGMGYMLCTKRVNSLAMCCREMANYALMDDVESEVITFYVPKVLLDEINSGRVKYYIHSGDIKSEYYADQEVELWKDFYDLYKDIADRIVFRNILTLIPNKKYEEKDSQYNSRMTAEQLKENNIKKAIVSGLQQKLTQAYVAEKKARRERGEDINEAVTVNDNPW